MTDSALNVVSEDGISRTWALTFLEVLGRTGTRIGSPLIVSARLPHGRDIEDTSIRGAVDEAIESINRRPGQVKIESIESTASTIFPRILWTPQRPRPRGVVFDRYVQRLLPRIKARSSRNQHGTYFERMIDFDGVNQLKEILEVWDREAGRGRRPRNSALHVSCYDPKRDNRRAARRGFPCLHQVGFSYRDHELSVHAWYPSEYIFTRGYGNYLGLARLGCFMAHEMRLRLASVHCYVAHPILSAQKALLRGLESRIRGMLASDPL